MAISMAVYEIHRIESRRFHFSSSSSEIGAIWRWKRYSRHTYTQIEGRFLHEMEHGVGRFRTNDPTTAHVYFLPFSFTWMVKYLYTPNTYDVTPLENFVSDYAILHLHRISGRGTSFLGLKPSEVLGNRDNDMRVYRYLPKDLDYCSFMLKSKFWLCPSEYEVASPRVVESIYAECVPETQAWSKGRQETFYSEPTG
ncbi:glycosyltransferase protein [Vigna angularis]|uniref:Glycosyltransferase protein n=1 Tax=Phaseolus angularis TaxID=3914 RepID=A0A8T0KK03_PHAAN|nr:glycosyltransferase protein [Vigna angularis]